MDEKKVPYIIWDVSGLLDGGMIARVYSFEMALFFVSQILDEYGKDMELKITYNGRGIDFKVSSYNDIVWLDD